MEIINTLVDISKNSINEYWNLDVIDKIYFIPKKVNKDLIEEKSNDEKYLGKLDKTIKFNNEVNVVDIVNGMFQDFVKDTGYELGDGKLYIIVGLDTTTIYSTNVDGEDVTVLCLEAINGDLDNLRMLLAHEYTHFIRKDLLKKDIFEECIGERIITEGIASNYSREMVPDMKDSDYTIVYDETVEWVSKNVIVIENIIRNNLNDNSLMSLLFYMFAKIDIKDMPVRCGYVYGYFKVKEYLERNNLYIKDIIGIDWKEILNYK